ncbi:kinase-like domain-containing protein [Cladochytrium replicatum]|nr:kinase-like domain-containing protein [Cladochytrium replicatum]
MNWLSIHSLQRVPLRKQPVWPSSWTIGRLDLKILVMVESMPSNAWLGFADPLAAIWDSTLATPSPDDLLLCAIRQDDSPPAENRSSRAPRARKNSPYSPPRTTSSASILKRAKVGSKSSCSPDQLQHDISDKENHPVLFNGMGRLVDHDSSPVRQQCETGLKSPPATTTPFSEKISNLLSHRFDVEDDDDEDYMDNQNEEEEEEDDEYDLEDDVEESDHNDDRHSEFTTTTEARYESSEEEQPSESQMDVDDNMAGNDHASHHEDAEDGLVGQDSDESQEDGDEDDPEADEEGNIDEDATTDRTGDDEKLDRRCLPRPELEENSSGIEPEENCSDMDTDCRTGNKAQRAALNRTYQNEHVENDISDSGNRRSCFEKGTRPPGMDSLIWEEVRDFYRDFNTLVENYYILDKIGEGTFSSVYKAVELTHGDWNNSDYCCKPSNPCDMPLVAIKRIYATSSPSRILNEIEILHRLRNSSDITKLIYADRDRDQIIVVLPYYEYTDFRAFFLDLSMDAIKDYMRSLFRAVRDMHEHRIIHRDIKPSNFLFQPEKGIGRLADFGLAQYETTKSDSPTTVRTRYENGRQISYTIPQYELGHPLGGSKYGCLVNDPRPSIKANRAGTRGFRAPEVLFKVVNQTTAIDIWSVGVILLSFFSGQFPFFQSNDDGEGLLEIAHIFGKSNMKKVARHFGKTFETNVPDVGPAQKLKDICMKFNPERASQVGRDGWDLLNRCLDLYPDTRIAAKQALNHPFLSDNPDTEFTFMDELVRH